jgi:hypothetical protein
LWANWERRTFEDEVAQTGAGYKRQDLDAGLAKFISKLSSRILGGVNTPWRQPRISTYSCRLMKNKELITFNQFPDEAIV